MVFKFLIKHLLLTSQKWFRNNHKKVPLSSSMPNSNAIYHCSKPSKHQTKPLREPLVSQADAAPSLTNTFGLRFERHHCVCELRACCSWAHGTVRTGSEQAAGSVVGEAGAEGVAGVYPQWKVGSDPCHSAAGTTVGTWEQSLVKFRMSPSTGWCRKSYWFWAVDWHFWLSVRN